MSEEKQDYKIEVPVFEYEELVQIDKMLDNDLDNIISKVTEQVLRDKELIFMQKIIEKQQKEIGQLKQDKNKLINYIAIREDIDFKDVVKKFDLGAE